MVEPCCRVLLSGPPLSGRPSSPSRATWICFRQGSIHSLFFQQIFIKPPLSPPDFSPLLLVDTWKVCSLCLQSASHIGWKDDSAVRTHMVLRIGGLKTSYNSNHGGIQCHFHRQLHSCTRTDIWTCMHTHNDKWKGIFKNCFIYNEYLVLVPLFPRYLGWILLLGARLHLLFLYVW